MKPIDVLSRHGSSFYLASRLLRPADARDITVLYAACRMIDDLADEGHHEPEVLQQITTALRQRDLEAIPVDGFAEMVERRQLDLVPLITLASRAAREAETTELVADEEALLDYCYDVAGTVGELMCPLIGANEASARGPATALGIGMQLTNIARDVLEDAQRGRRYLPGTWVAHLSAQTIAEARSDDLELVQRAIGKTVRLAESYYCRADENMSLIPFRNRQAIRIAARLYRAIGLRVLDQGCRYWEGRVSLSSRERISLALRTLFGPGYLSPPQGA